MTQTTFTFDAIGTPWAISVDLPDSPGSAVARLERDVRNRIALFDRTYSRFRTDSWAAGLAGPPGTFRLPPDAHPLIEFYDRLYQATAGAVTPLIGQTMAALGYGPSLGLADVAPPPLHAALIYDPDTVSTRQPVHLDVGAAGKGYIVDLVHDMLIEAGSVAHFIDAGHDIRHYAHDGATLDVGLENPRDVSQAVGVTQIGNQGIAASSGALRRWGKYHHIIDPRTSASPESVIATWVIADTAMVADGLATALFLVEPEALARFDFEYGVLDAGMTLTYSPGFPARLFTESMA